MALFEAVINLPEDMPSAMGVGAFLKNNICLIQKNKAFISRDMGSLDNADSMLNFEKAANEIIASAEEKPALIAHDLHPDFFSTRFAQSCGIKSLAVQHHHAHVAAVMAEFGLTEPVLGLALDGFGLGLNGESWGGELLEVDSTGFRRIGHLRPMPQPGGDAAARQTWRMGAAALWAMGRGTEIAIRYGAFPNSALLNGMMDKKINCPTTSSAGRLFDAACGLLGVKLVAAFEGEAPMALEALARNPKTDDCGWKIEEKDGVMVLDMLPLMGTIANEGAEEGANLFHGTFAAALADFAQKAAQKTGISRVALCGGCFFNKVLREELVRRIMDSKMIPLLPSRMSFGDGAISLGQAWVATMKMKTGKI